MFAFVSTPADKLAHILSTLLLVHSFRGNDLTDEAKQALLQDAAGSSARIHF